MERTIVTRSWVKLSANTFWSSFGSRIADIMLETSLGTSNHVVMADGSHLIHNVCSFHVHEDRFGTVSYNLFGLWRHHTAVLRRNQLVTWIFIRVMFFSNEMKTLYCSSDVIRNFSIGNLVLDVHIHVHVQALLWELFSNSQCTWYIRFEIRIYETIKFSLNLEYNVSDDSTPIKILSSLWAFDSIELPNSSILRTAWSVIILHVTQL